MEIITSESETEGVRKKKVKLGDDPQVPLEMETKTEIRTPKKVPEKKIVNKTKTESETETKPGRVTAQDMFKAMLNAKPSDCTTSESENENPEKLVQDFLSLPVHRPRGSASD